MALACDRAKRSRTKKLNDKKRGCFIFRLNLSFTTFSVDETFLRKVRSMGVGVIG